MDVERNMSGGKLSNTLTTSPTHLPKVVVRMVPTHLESGAFTTASSSRSILLPVSAVLF